MTGWSQSAVITATSVAAHPIRRLRVPRIGDCTSTTIMQPGAFADSCVADATSGSAGTRNTPRASIATSRSEGGEASNRFAYQDDGIEFLRSHPRALLAHEPG